MKMTNKTLSQDPQGLGRRRPRMGAKPQQEDPNVRPWNKPDPPELPQRAKTPGPHPRGPGICPKCGQSVPRLAVHVRQCSGGAK